MDMPSPADHDPSSRTIGLPASGPPFCHEFVVDDVQLPQALIATQSYPVAVRDLLARLRFEDWCDRDLNPAAAADPPPLEACSRYHGELITKPYCHPFLGALYHAFGGHRPLILSPDMLWLLVIQGFAQHVNAHAESLRHRFVQHAGQIKLVAPAFGFVKNSPENPWGEIIAEFSRQIRQHIGPAAHDCLVPRFTTTGAIEQAAAEVSLLDALQQYFRFEAITMCGIPRISLEGTPNDWKELARRTHALGDYDLRWWTDRLDPILEEFASAARGVVHRDFWQSIFKWKSASGGSKITGWIKTFFPYVGQSKPGHPAVRNPFLSSLDQYMPLASIPLGRSTVPFDWNYYGQIFPMEFLGGFLGIRQNPQTLQLRPEIGWAIRQA